MKAKYTHKFIIYNRKRIRDNYRGLVEKLADFKSEAIPKDLLESLKENSQMFAEKRREFYRRNPASMCTIDEILPYSEEANIETNKVLAFIKKYNEFDCLIAAVDYFNGEDEYIEKYHHHEDPGYFGGWSMNFFVKATLGYYYGISRNNLDILLKEMDLEELI